MVLSTNFERWGEKLCSGSISWTKSQLRFQDQLWPMSSPAAAPPCKQLLFWNVLETRDHLLELGPQFVLTGDMTRIQAWRSQFLCLQPTAWPCSSTDKLKYSSWTVSSSSWPSEHKTGSSLGVLNHLLARLPAPSSGSFLSSKKISYMALQRSSKTRERSSSCYTTFHCFGQQRLAWLVGEHIVCPQYCCTLLQASSYRQPLSHW